MAKKDITLKNDWTEADLDAAILSGMDADVPKTLCQLTDVTFYSNRKSSALGSRNTVFV